MTETSHNVERHCWLGGTPLDSLRTSHANIRKLTADRA
jgi:hypothetical protein